MRFTCGTLAVDLGETTHQRQRRVRKLRAWHTIAGNSSDGSLADPHSYYGKDAVGTADSHEHEHFPKGEDPISVKNPAYMLTPKERSGLVTQQRIVDLYARNSKQPYDVLRCHIDKPINLAEFKRCSQIAGIRIAPADAERRLQRRQALRELLAPRRAAVLVEHTSMQALTPNAKTEERAAPAAARPEVRNRPNRDIGYIGHHKSQNVARRGYTAYRVRRPARS